MTKPFETLEARRLLALVNWDGGGNSANWLDPANWSGDAVPGPDDEVTIATAITLEMPTGTHLRSLTLEGSTVSTSFGSASTFTIESLFRIGPGGKFQIRELSSVTLEGTGNLDIETGGTLQIDSIMQYSGNLGTRMPVTNHGVFTGWGATLKGGLRNFGQVVVRNSGALWGGIINEESGLIRIVNSGWSPSSSIGPNYTIGLGQNDANAIVPVPVINRGRIESDYPALTNSLPYEWGGPNNPAIGLTVYVNATPTLSGTWGSGDDTAIKFARYGSGAIVPVTFDSDFRFEAGTLVLSNLDATVSGMGTNTGLSLTGHTRATFADDRTELAYLNTKDTASFSILSGSRTLRVQDLVLLNSTAFDVSDGLFIHGNQPGFMRSWATGTPTDSPTYSSQVVGNYEGSTVRVDPDGNRRGVGFSTGSGLAAHYPAHTFRGETFDDNDFVFFTTLRGDANFDRQVNFDDLLAVSQRYGQSTSRGYADGNFSGAITGSGTTSFDDLLILAQNYGMAFVQVPIVAAAEKKRLKASDVLA